VFEVRVEELEVDIPMFLRQAAGQDHVTISLPKLVGPKVPFAPRHEADSRVVVRGSHDIFDGAASEGKGRKRKGAAAADAADDAADLWASISCKGWLKHVSEFNAAKAATAQPAAPAASASSSSAGDDVDYASTKGPASHILK
jgi:hypothetical protein